MERDEDELARAVLAYLAEHPQAMDTVEGIARWWLMRQQVRANITMLMRVLDDLTARGRLELIGNGENRRYRLRPTS